MLLMSLSPLLCRKNVGYSDSASPQAAKQVQHCETALLLRSVAAGAAAVVEIAVALGILGLFDAHLQVCRARDRRHRDASIDRLPIGS